MHVYRDKPCESIKPVSYLKNLTELYLDVPSAAVSDIAPLKGLTKLKKLSIESDVSENISVLGNMKNLRELKIHVSKGADLTVLEKLTKLETLKIYGDCTAEGLDSIVNLKKLKNLSLDGFYNYYGKHPDLSFIGEMTGLESLSLSYSNKSFTNTIGNLKGLKELSLLDINNCRTYDMSFLEELTGLESLFLFGHYGIDRVDYSKMKNLKSLDILLCEFKDLSSIKKCSSLEHFSVYNCNTDFDVKWIAGTNIKSIFFSGGASGIIENMDKLSTLKKLEKLSLDFTGIPEETIKKIKKAVPKCRIEVCELDRGEYDERVY